jgi:hypothetical protein
LIDLKIHNCEETIYGRGPILCTICPWAVEGKRRVEIDTFFKAKLWAERINNKIGKKYAEMDNIQQTSQADVKGNSRSQRATIKYLDGQIKISVILQLT